MFWRRRRSFGRILATASLAVFIFFTLYVASANGLEYQVDSIELTVHRDGSVHVTQILTVDETFPSISFPSLASEVENILVVDENWTLLRYEMDGSRFTVFSLGAKTVVLDYDSIFLTEKEAGERGDDGTYPEGSINQLANKRLEEIAEGLKEFYAEEKE